MHVLTLTKISIASDNENDCFETISRRKQSGHGVKSTDFLCASPVYLRSQPVFRLDKQIGRNILPLDSTPKV